jgi:peptidyl-prolyl cis-trans isomerase B (cyclophilin B)
MTVPPYWPPPAPPPNGYPYEYPAPAAPGPYGPPPTNAMAIASMVCAFLFAPLGIVFGHISLSQIRRTGEQGHSLAVAGLVLSYLFTALTVAMLVLMVVVIGWSINEVHKLDRTRIEGRTYSASPPAPDLPVFTAPASLGVCEYPGIDQPAARRVSAPRAGKIPTMPTIVDATMTIDIAGQPGELRLRLDNAKAPCTVNSFTSLARQKFFDDTPCHRLTANNSLSVLQCGDPTGTGRGGPGYRFADEYPANQFAANDPKRKVPLRYPRGSLVMANSGPDTNGSQFFIVWKDSKLPPTYTLFGSVDAVGMAVIDQVAEAGVSGGNLDGRPKFPVTISAVAVI